MNEKYFCLGDFMNGCRITLQHQIVSKITKGPFCEALLKLI